MASPLDRLGEAVVGPLLETFGRSATYIVPGESGYDPGTLDTDAGEDAETAIKVVPAEQELRKMGRDPDTLAEKGQVAVMMADVVGQRPSTAHRVRMNGREWAIDEALEIATGEQAGGWILVLESA